MPRLVACLPPVVVGLVGCLQSDLRLLQRLLYLVRLPALPCMLQVPQQLLCLCSPRLRLARCRPARWLSVVVLPRLLLPLPTPVWLRVHRWFTMAAAQRRQSQPTPRQW